jgi:hypothetical protein
MQKGRVGRQGAEKRSSKVGRNRYWAGFIAVQEAGGPRGGPSGRLITVSNAGVGPDDKGVACNVLGGLFDDRKSKTGLCYFGMNFILDNRKNKI